MTDSGQSIDVDALVFDAYGTLFDVHSVTALAEQLVPGRGAALSQLWRAKQLEYTWLGSLMTAPTLPRADFADRDRGSARLRAGGAWNRARRRRVAHVSRTRT